MRLNNPSLILLLLLPLLYLSTVNCTFPPNDAYNNKINGTPSRRITLRRNVNGNIVGANKKAETLINPPKKPRRLPSIPLKPLLLLLPRFLSLFRLSRLLLLLKISLPLLLLKHSLTFLYTRETRQNERKRRYLPHLHIPHPWVFPAIWWPLKLLQLLSVLKLLRINDVNGSVLGKGGYGWGGECLGWWFGQTALGEEWNRVLFVERRIGLGLAVAGAHLAAISRCYYCFVRLNSKRLGRVSLNNYILPSVIWCAGGVLMNLSQFRAMRRDMRQQRKRYSPSK
ncbi:hypothetical protein TrVE_jg3724 [Triparma verrucosa]|uniref:Uncharacterized protein n=1 Tax=Triparma verrucosa TaxID=1606542 RepID=A0A9W7BXN0_9STRA|nr:hypothetical protein TrVE_jg3724 [Triparma verrucosa]